ncbi:MAG: hypothetical protein ACLQGU_22715 [bacterium]
MHRKHQRYRRRSTGKHMEPAVVERFGACILEVEQDRFAGGYGDTP